MFTLNKINILVAYPYLKDSMIDFVNNHQDEFRFVLDSGAFTAWKSRKPIKLDDYCRFIEAMPFKPWRYFTLDVIGNPEESFKNYEKMVSRGLNPIPIFTRGESPSMIDRYYQTSEVLGVGGLVGTKGNKGFVKELMGLIGPRKVHLLGFTHANFIAHFKPYMCDCSSWSYVTRYGSMFVYDFMGKFDSIYRKEFVSKPPDKIMQNIQKLGFNVNDFQKESAWRGDFCLSKILNAKSYLLKSQDAEKLFGTKMFLACSSLSDLQIFLSIKRGNNENISFI